MMRLFIFAVACSLIACNNPKGEKAETSEKQQVAEASGVQFKVDTSSLVTWTGTKPTGSHTGTFRVSDGSISVTDNKITAGNFTIDIKSLQNKDLTEDDGKGKLEGHLKSADFFDADKYPTAKFEITSVEPYVADSAAGKTANATHMIKGNLTLKDSTKNISFPARVNISESSISADADFNIDRTEWGMNYKGPNNPQDWVISKQVNLKLALKGNKS